MKILYVITKSNFGGAQRYVLELAQAMKESGHEVAVAVGGNGLLVERLKTADITVFPILSFERDINLFKELKSMGELKNIYATFNPDVVHLNSSKAGGTGALIARLTGVKNIVFTAHGWPFLEDRFFLSKWIIWFFSYLTGLLAHRIILVSENDMRNTKMPGVASKCRVIRTALPGIDFKPREAARDVLYRNKCTLGHAADTWVVSTGEFTKNKNLFRLVDAVVAHNLENDQQIFLSLIGDGENREDLQNHIDNKHATGNICLLGYIPDARLYLKAFDIFVLPSLKEGMPYGLLEAGAAGLPSVASNVGGIPEIIEDGVSGTLIDPRNVTSLSHALTHYTLNKQDAEHHAKALKEKVRASFTLDQMIAETKRMYRV